jgi:hypothetical protein
MNNYRNQVKTKFKLLSNSNANNSNYLQNKNNLRKSNNNPQRNTQIHSNTNNNSYVNNNTNHQNQINSHISNNNKNNKFRVNKQKANILSNNKTNNSNIIENKNKTKVEIHRSSEKKNVLTIKIKVTTHQEYENLKNLYSEYQTSLSQYKSSIESFNKFIEKLILKFNFKNVLLKLIKERSFTRIPSPKFIYNIKKIAEYSLEYYNLTKDINNKIQKFNNFHFDENNPAHSFKKGIEIFNKITNLIKNGLDNLKIIYDNTSQVQKEIIEDESFPISLENKMLIFDNMKKISFEDLNKRDNKEIILDNDACVICMNNFNKDDKIKVFSCKKHIYHDKCLELWIQRDFKCPLCKYNLKKEILKYNLY